MAYLNWLIGWLSGHPLLYGFVLFLISCVVSLYSNEIKRFLHVWPKTKLSEAHQSAVRQRLDLMKRLHKNPYNLIFYFAQEFISMIYEWLVLAVLFTIASSIWKQIPPASFIPFCIGALTGRCQRNRTMLNQLAHYEEIAPLLERQLQAAAPALQPSPKADDL